MSEYLPTDERLTISGHPKMFRFQIILFLRSLSAINTQYSISIGEQHCLNLTTILSDYEGSIEIQTPPVASTSAVVSYDYSRAMEQSFFMADAENMLITKWIRFCV